jgi:predicted DNA-binding WGR domain protein
MKLINQVRLEFRQGTSDKVYEVDLCEVGPGQFVVNFRYGRRGTTLRDGSKTAAPVTQARAQAIFDALVAEKRSKGYRNAHGTPSPTAPSVVPPQPQTPAPPPNPPVPPTPPPIDTGSGSADRDPELEAAQLAAAPCPECGKPRRVFRVKKPGANQGRLFLKCGDPQCGLFEWAPTPSVVPTLAAASARAGNTAQEEGVLRRLRQGYGVQSRGRAASKAWRLSRAIWRAGEMGLRETEPLLLNLLDQTLQNKARRRRFDRDATDELLGSRFLTHRGRGGTARWSESFAPPDDMLLYTLAWSVGRCGSAASVPALRNLLEQEWEPIGRIASAALLLRLEGNSRAVLVEGLTIQLPEPLRALCRSGPAEAFQQALQEYLDGSGTYAAGILDLLYQIDNATIRPALLHLLRTVPLRTTYFQPLRHIFKIAEFRRDAEVFGILAHRFETEPFGESKFQAQVRVTTFQRYGSRIGQENAIVTPFGKRSRTYFRRRVWRTLERLGDLGDLDYVRLAVGVLLPFTDANAEEPAVGRRGLTLCRYWAYNQILYRNSPRYQLRRNNAYFVCQRPYSPGGPEATQREEAFPHLWQAQPDALLQLLERSRCGAVHRFAVKALLDCPDFCSRLPLPALARLLEAPYEVTQELGFELAVHRYDPAHPSLELVLAMAHSGLAQARTKARGWIDWQRNHFIQDLPFLAALAGSPQAETRQYARELLRHTTFTSATAEALIGRIVALLLTFAAGQGERARDTARTLQDVFAAPLHCVGLPVILDLLAHPLPELRLFAGELVLAHETFANQPPEDLLLRLLQDSEASVRGVGVRLLGQLPEQTLKENLQLLVALSRHELVDFRANIRPVVKRLADADPIFGQRIAERLVEALLTPGAPEGVPSYTAGLLREDFAAHLGAIPTATIWKLLQARSTVAQEVGGLLLAANVKPDDLSLAEIVKLASHDILSVREAAWQMCRSSLVRLKKDMDTATRLVDAKWDDSRQFAFGLLRDAFHREELTPAILVSLCDSVRPDVQQFGREMITRLFGEQDGPEYALKLSEHPSPSMQMFSATFLERYAGDNPGHLRELAFYFQSVLSRVNQGRVARDRVFAFLQKVAQSSAESAAIVAEVLGRASATVAIGDRARAIEILTGIHAAHPAVAMPLRVLPVEVRRGV